MKKETVRILGIAKTERLNSKTAILLCRLAAKMSELGVMDDLIYEILISAVIEDNSGLIEFMDRWIKRESKQEREKIQDEIQRLIAWNRTVEITVEDLVPKSDFITANLMLFKKGLGNKIREDYPEGIPGLIKDMKLNKAAFYRFLSEERVPNEDMIDLIKKIFSALAISRLELIKPNPKLLGNEKE